MNILSVFITSNKLILYLYVKNSGKNFEFPFYPSFQNSADIEYIIEKFLETLKLKVEEVTILAITTGHPISIFGKNCLFLNDVISKYSDFSYIYFNDLTLYSYKNISAISLGLSKRSDNFISNRSKFPSSQFTSDVEELVYLSKSIEDTFNPKNNKIVVGGDYFTNDEIPYEYKMNFLSEILSSGFYEILIDSKNEFPNFCVLKMFTQLGIKEPEFEKFIYLISSTKDTQLQFQKESKKKYLDLPLNETAFIHFNEIENLKLEYKGREIGKGEVTFDFEYAGLFIDRRTYEDKKLNLGVESFRKVLSSIDKDSDFDSL